MKCEIVSIGDELLIGQTVNTNASWLCEQLAGLGVEVAWITTVGDDAADIKTALATAMTRTDLVLATGGLGPTHDDITKNVAAEYFDSKLVFKPEILKRLQLAFQRRGIKMSKTDEGQAFLPEKAEIVKNPVGTAPGLLFTQGDKKCVILPGVPMEMKAICEESIFPMLKGVGQVIRLKILRTTGIPESTLFEQIGDIEAVEKFARVAFLPKAGGVDIRLTAKDGDSETCDRKLADAVDLVNARLGDQIYAHDRQELFEVVGKQLLSKKKSIAVAESSTGGLLANRLTDMPGSSGYFISGVVPYSNQAKIDILKVPSQVIERHGAVSPETAEAMAKGIRKLAHADIGVSTTGIAGPDGGSPEKPVGLVYVGISTAKHTYSKRYVFTKHRLLNKERSVQTVLRLLLQELNNGSV